MPQKSAYFVWAIVAALASFASFFARFLIGDRLQIVLAIFGVVAIGAAGALLALGFKTNADD